MTAALALERAVADGRVSDREWREDLSPAFRSLSGRAAPAPQRLLEVLANEHIAIAETARSSARDLLSSQFGYDIPAARLTPAKARAAARRNVTSADEHFEWLLRHAGTAGRQVPVAIIDLGFSEDSSLNHHVNETEAHGWPGEDDDGNGLADDIHGYDFKSRESDLSGPYRVFDSHGNHV
ncbi:MAG: hypothetical protein AAF658_17200, partial [Myxococcota bacterium]